MGSGLEPTTSLATVGSGVLLRATVCVCRPINPDSQLLDAFLHTSDGSADLRKFCRTLTAQLLGS